MAITFVTINPDGTSVFTGLSSDTPTAADTPITADVLRPGSIIWDSDTNQIRQYNGSAWNPISIGGAGHVTDPSYTLVKYTGSGYTYLCDAVMGTARSTAAWRVFRVTDATGDGVYAGVAGTTVGTFAFAATDLATVAALTYTLGA